ncbi:MAG: hypothetical protein RLY57_386 [Candidatus Parcubacteria bacterium]
MKDPLKTIESLQNISLSSHEKAAMFSHIQQHIDNTLAKPVQSPFSFFSFIQHHSVYATSFALLLVIAASSAAAETAIPGDLLYSVKRNVTENIMQALTFSNESHAQVQISLVNRRLNEAEKLIAKKDPENEPLLVSLATEAQVNASSALDAIQDIHDEESPVVALELSNDLSSTLNAHDSYIDSVVPTEVATDLFATRMAADTSTTNEPATMMFSNAKVAATVEASAPTINSIVEDTKNQVEAVAQGFSARIQEPNENVVSEEKLQEQSEEIEHILKNENVSTSTKAYVQDLVESAKHEPDHDNAFIILEEASKVGNSDIQKEHIEKALQILD